MRVGPIPTFILSCLLFTCLMSTSIKKKIDIDLFIVSQCPYSQEFITSQIYPTIVEKLKSADQINFNIYPANGEDIEHPEIFDCMHGDEECQMNLYLACLSNLTGNNPLIFLPVVKCLIDKGMEVKTVHECLPEKNHYDLVKSCAEGQIGVSLMKKIVERSVKQNITGYPWMVIDGKDVSNRAEDDFLALLCGMEQIKSNSACETAKTTNVTNSTEEPEICSKRTKRGKKKKKMEKKKRKIINEIAHAKPKKWYIVFY